MEIKPTFTQEVFVKKFWDSFFIDGKGDILNFDVSS